MKLNLTKNLEVPKTNALAQIDADASRALERYRTKGDYAVAVYAQKRVELSMFEAGETSTDALVLLSSEAAARGVSVDALAKIWRERMDAESEVLPKIEATRQIAKQAIRSARTPAEIDAVLANITWP